MTRHTEKSAVGAQHTLGPWDVMEGRTLLHVETRHDNSSGAGVAVCSIPKSRAGDARLIAAAPELLEALTNCVEEIEFLFARLGEEAISSDMQKAIESARAAIARTVQS